MDDVTDIESLLSGLGLDAGGDPFPPDTQPDHPIPARSDEEHEQNLVDLLLPDERREIGRSMLRGWEEDREARRPWEEAASRGKEALGMLAQIASDDWGGGLEHKRTGAEGPKEVWQSQAVAPLAVEGLMRMTASISKEVFRPNGVCRGKVIGDRWANKAVQEQADRVAAFVNLLYNDDEMMPDARDGLDALVQLIVDEGGAYREPYWDETTGLPDVATHTLDKVWMPFDARSAYRSRRVTIAFPLLAGTIRRMQADGYYAAIEGEIVPGDDDLLETEVDRAARVAGGFTEQAEDETAETSDPRKAMHGIPDERMVATVRQFCLRVLPEQIDGGLMLPYRGVLTPDGQLLRLERDWKNGDAHARRQYRLIKYGMFPVPRCPYPVGICHMLGFLAETATDVLRAIIDATKRSMKTVSLLGNEVNVEDLRGNTQTISPNGADEFIQIKSSAMDFKQAVVTLKSDPPSAVPFQLLGMLKEAYEKAANTADLMAGTANPQGPVGTAMILVEQGSRVYSAVHARIHASASREYSALLRVIRDNIDPTTEYPMRVSGGGEPVYILSDIDDRIDVEPVSDPTEYSETQRIAKAQAMLEVYLKDPTVYDKRAVHTRFLEAVGIPDISELIPDPTEIPRCDVVTENQRLLMGMPIRAYPGQAHAAHLQEHQRFFGGLPPEGQKMLQGIYLSHMGEHMALIYREQAAQALAAAGEPMAGREVMLQPDLWEAKAEHDEETQEMDPERERLLDAMVAAAMAQSQPAPAGQGAGGEQQDGSEQANMIRARAAATTAAVDGHAKQRQDARDQEAHDLDMQQKRIGVAKGLQEVAGAARDATGPDQRGAETPGRPGAD